jgi:hypothetical protein
VVLILELRKNKRKSTSYVEKLATIHRILLIEAQKPYLWYSNFVGISEEIP